MSKLSPIIRFTLLSLLMLFGGLGLTASAQQFTGTIQGVVRDSSGAVVAGAEVSIINTETGETRTVTTDDNGAYVAPQLRPALYRVTVKKSGFKTAMLDEIKLDVQQIRAVDMSLDIGQTTESVSVTASGAAAIETVSSTVSQTIENSRPTRSAPNSGASAAV